MDLNRERFAVTQPHDADQIPSSPPEGDLVLIFDASNEGEAISSALQQRGFAVGMAPLARLESRLLSDTPSVMLIDVDQPGVLEAVERVGELSLIHRVVLVFLGDPIHEDSLRKVGASGKLFPRPVNIELLADHVATYATPVQRVSRVRESSVPEASSPRDTMPPPTNDSDSPAAVDYTSNQDPFDIESILPFGDDVLKPPADLPTRLSPELEQLMLSAERRVGTLVHRSSMPPPDEEDAPLPPEYLSILDEPLEAEEDDSFVGFPSFDGTPGPPESDEDEPLSSDRRAETDKRPVMGEAVSLRGAAADEAPPTPREKKARPREVVTRNEAAAERERPREVVTRNEAAAERERPREVVTRNEPAAERERPREVVTRNEPAAERERPKEVVTRNEPAAERERPKEVVTRNEPTPVRERPREAVARSEPAPPERDRPLPAPARLPEETPKAGTYLGQQLEAISRVSASSTRASEQASPQAPSADRQRTSRSVVAPPTQVAAGRPPPPPMSHVPATEAMGTSPFSHGEESLRAGGLPYDDSPRRSVVTRGGLTRGGLTRPDVDSAQGVPSIGGTTFSEVSGRFPFGAPPGEATHRAPSVPPPSVAHPRVPAPPPPRPPPASPAPRPRSRPSPPLPAPPLPSPPVPAHPAGRAGSSSADQIPEVLGQGDAPLALARAIAGRISGSLALSGSTGVRRIVLQDGDVVTAASWAPDETLLAFLVARGDIERDLIPQLEGKLPSYGRIAGAALIARGHLGQDDLWPVLRAHAEWVIGRALLLASGTCEIETEPPARLTAEPNVFGGATGAEVLIESVRRVIPPETAMTRIGGPRARVSLGPRQSLLSECALRSDEMERIRSAQGRSVGDLLEGADAEIPNVLYALACLGVIEILKAVAPAREETPLEPDPYDEEAVRQRIRARLALVEDGDYFALLGVPRAATSYEVRRAYLELRRAFEPSRLLTAATADLHADVQVILDVLDEAFDILRDAHRRERYRRAIESAGPS